MRLVEWVANRWIYGKPKKHPEEETLWGWIARNAAPDQPQIRVFGNRSAEWIEAMAQARAWCRLKHQNVRLDYSMVNRMWIIEDSEEERGN